MGFINQLHLVAHPIDNPITPSNPSNWLGMSTEPVSGRRLPGAGTQPGDLFSWGRPGTVDQALFYLLKHTDSDLFSASRHFWTLTSPQDL